MFRNIPHTLSDARLGLLVILLAVAGGAIWLYNPTGWGGCHGNPKAPPTLSWCAP